MNGARYQIWTDDPHNVNVVLSTTEPIAHSCIVFRYDLTIVIPFHLAR